MQAFTPKIIMRMNQMTRFTLQSCPYFPSKIAPAQNFTTLLFSSEIFAENLNALRLSLRDSIILKTFFVIRASESNRLYWLATSEYSSEIRFCFFDKPSHSLEFLIQD